MGTNEPILTISIAAKLLNIHPRTIMLYERAKLFSSHRTGTQRRMFSEGDLEKLQFIKYLTQKRGVNLQGVKLILEAIEAGERGGVDLKARLFSDFKVEKLF